MWKRQTIHQLAQTHGMSERAVRYALDRGSLPSMPHIPQETAIAADMTFWGRGYGVMVFRSPTLKQNLWWKESLFEMPFVYQEGLYALQREGWRITGVVIDGKRGVARVFERQGIPVQHCQFHQMKTVTKYLTRRPKTEAAQELKALTCTLKDTDESAFRARLGAWHRKHAAFLDEKTSNPDKKRGWDYTHRRVRAAHRSLAQNCRRLFSHQRHPELNLPNTTNTLDGMFSQIKNRLAVHRGLAKERRYKLISEVLQGKN